MWWKHWHSYARRSPLALARMWWKHWSTLENSSKPTWMWSSHIPWLGVDLMKTDCCIASFGACFQEPHGSPWFPVVSVKRCPELSRIFIQHGTRRICSPQTEPTCQNCWPLGWDGILKTGTTDDKKLQSNPCIIGILNWLQLRLTLCTLWNSHCSAKHNTTLIGGWSNVSWEHLFNWGE